MSLIDSDEVRTAMNERVARSLGPPRKAPNRFWDHLSFCATLFWALRKMKHLRAGQLLGAVLAKNTDPKDVKSEAELAYYIFAQSNRDVKTKFVDQIGLALASAERAHMLSRTEDDHLSHLIEDYVMNQQNHCDSK
jgi:hypothetical protein